MMNNSDSDIEGPIGFYEKYLTLSDDRIKEILRNHKNYQESAVKAVVKIAIERELIHSEQDLLAPEYQTDPVPKFSLFPEITNAYHYKKVVASIFRVLFIVSLLPVIYGVLKYSEGQINMTIAGIGTGCTWLVITYLLYKKKILFILNLQIVVLTFLFLGITYRLINMEVFKLIDMVMLIIGTTIILFFLLYLRKLLQTKPDVLSGM